MSKNARFVEIPHAISTNTWVELCYDCNRLICWMLGCLSKDMFEKLFLQETKLTPQETKIKIDIIKTIISRDVQLAYFYTVHVVDKPLKICEPIIVTHPWYALWYRGHFYYDKPWPEAESAILMDAQCCYEYIVFFLKKRWPEGEKTIATSSYWWPIYTKYMKIPKDELTYEEEEAY